MHAYTRFENGRSENSTQKLLTKYSTEEKNKHIICRPRSVRIGKNCALGLEYGPRPQDLWYSFSQYGPPGRQITYMYLHTSAQCTPTYDEHPNFGLHFSHTTGSHAKPNHKPYDLYPPHTSTQTPRCV